MKLAIIKVNFVQLVEYLLLLVINLDRYLGHCAWKQLKPEKSTS